MSDVAVLGLRVDASGAIVSTNQLGQSLDKLGGQSERAETSIKTLATRMLSFVAVGAVMRTAVTEAIAFADAMAEVSTLLADTSSMDGMTASVRALSVEFGKSPIEEAKALYQIISAGASDAAEALDILTVSNRLAVGGVTTVSTAADGLTSILNAYGASVGSATSVSDALFVAMRAGKTTIDELASGIGTVAPIAATAGVALEDVLAATASLTKGGQNTRVALTGLRAIMATILKPSSEAATQAAALGFEFNATALKAKGLQGFLAELSVATGGSVDAMAQLFGGVEALVPALALVGNGAADYSTILEDMGTRADQTTIAFDKMAQSPGFQLNKLLATAKDEALGLGLALVNTLAPVIVLLTQHMKALVEAAGAVAAIFAARFFGAMLADATKFIQQLAAQRAATVAAAAAATASAAEAATASAQRVAALKAEQVQLRLMMATERERLALSTARLARAVPVERLAPLGAAVAQRDNAQVVFAAKAQTEAQRALNTAQTRSIVLNGELAAANAVNAGTTTALATAQTNAARTTSVLAATMTGAASAGRLMWAAIGGPIGATVIALYALYKIFIDNSKAVQALADSMQGARDRATEYAGTLSTLSDDALKAAEAQERLNLATIAAKLATASTAVVESKETAGNFTGRDTGVGAKFIAEAAAAQADYNARLVEAEEATQRLAAAVAARTTRERQAQDAAAQAALDRKAAAEARTQEFTEASGQLKLELEKQQALNAAFGKSKKEMTDIAATYELRAKVQAITTKFTGEEATQLVALATALADADAKQRNLNDAQEKELDMAELRKKLAADDNRLREARAKDDQELRKALQEKAALRAAGAKQAARDIELLQREIELFGKSAAEARTLGDAYLWADKQAEYLASGLDAVAASTAATDFVSKKNELDGLTQSTINWGEALSGVNDAMLLLIQSLSGGAKEAAQMVGALSASVQLLVKAQETAKKNANTQKSAGDIAGGALGAGVAGFGAGSAFGSTTSNRTVGAVGGALTGAATGAMVGATLGPVGVAVGAVIGGLAGALGGFMSASKNATQEALAAASAQKALRESLAGLRATLSGDTLGLAIASTKQQFEALRAAANKAFAGKKGETERNKILAELNTLQAVRIAQLRAEYTETQRRAQVDLEVRALRAKGLGLEAAAIEFAEKQQRELADAQKGGASAATLAALAQTQLAEAQQFAAATAEQQRRTLTDLATQTLALTDPRQAGEDAAAEEATRRVYDAIQRGASEAELAALALYNTAVLARREADLLEQDRRTSEALVGRALRAGGDTRGAEDAVLVASQRQELADAVRDGMSPMNLALLQYTLFAEREALLTRRAIEDGTKAIQDSAKNETAAIDVLIEVTRTAAAAQLAALDEQIAAVTSAAQIQSKAFDAQITDIRERTKERTEALDAQIAAARQSLEVQKQQVGLLEKQVQTGAQVVTALTEFAQSLALGNLSTLSPEAKLDEARRQFEDLAAAAAGGDANAAAGLPGAATALLEASRAFNASNSGFTEDANRVNAVIASITTQFGNQLSIDEQLLAVQTSALAAAESSIESLQQQRTVIEAAAQREIELVQAAKDEAAENARKLIEQLEQQKTKISADAEATVLKLEETRQAIIDTANKQIEQLIADENAKLQTRLREHQFYDTFAQYAANATTFFTAAQDAQDVPTVAEGGGGGSPGAPAGATPAQVAAEATVAELKELSRRLGAQLEQVTERLDRLTSVAVSSTEQDVRATQRVENAVQLVASAVREQSQANAVRNRPVGIV